LAVASDDYTLRTLDITSGATELLCTAGDRVTSVAYSPDGQMLAAGDDSGTVWFLWPAMTLQGGKGHALEVAWSPRGKLLAAGHGDGTVVIRSLAMGMHTAAVLQAHQSTVGGLSFSADGNLLASKSNGDDLVRLWSCLNWECVGEIVEEGINNVRLWRDGLAFHPRQPLLATLGERDTVVRIWDIDVRLLLARAVTSVHYKNARVVLAGDSGVGKTALWMRLCRDDFAPTESTHGRQVRTLDRSVVHREDGGEEEREIVLWDLGGQPGYRLTHQLHLHEADAAVVVFDSRSEAEAFAGVEYWGRALSSARLRRRREIVKFLVAARKDRGGLASSRERIERLRSRLGFAEFLETSAKTGEGVTQLREAISRAIEWETLVPVTSTELFGRVRQFVEEARVAGRLLCNEDELRKEYELRVTPLGTVEFGNALQCLETQGVLRRLSFGDLVLLAPELLDGYTSAISVAAKEEPEGMGHLLEEKVLAGEFDLEPRLRIPVRGLERLVLIATIDKMLRNEVALREHSSEGAWLVFPSQISREEREAPPSSAGVWFHFDGSVETIYATLIVRLSHSGICKRAGMWSDGARFTAFGGGSCDIRVRESSEGAGSIELTFAPHTAREMQAAIEEYVRAHIERRAAPGSLKRHRAWGCSSCGTPVTEAQVANRRQRGYEWMTCGVCDDRIDLIEPAPPERTKAETVPEMDRAANDRRRELVAETALRGKEETGDFDVFLAHSSQDKPAVRVLAAHLKRRGLRPWVDEEQIPPGCWFQDVIQAAIPRVKSAAVVVGPDGLGRWEAVELRAFLARCVEHGLTLIPVLLPGVLGLPDDLAFLRQLNWVQFVNSTEEEDALAKLEWGITGQKGRFADALLT
jgi:small GTP-binding protein